MNNNKGVYAIIDTKADDILGILHMHKHEAAAVRFFSDIALQKGSLIGAHPEDFVLVKVGQLTDNHNIEPCFRIVLEGAAWAAAQQPETERQLEHDVEYSPRATRSIAPLPPR